MDWKRGTVAFLVLLVGVGVLFLLRDEEEPVLTAHTGYPVYREYCKRCHGVRGDARKASRMAERGVSLIDPAFRDTTDVEKVVEVVERGRRKMKGFSEKLDQEEIEAVSRYVLDLPPRSEVP